MLFMIFIVTGEKDSGKTTFAHDVVSALQKKGLVIRGFLSPGKPGTRHRKRFDLFDLTGRRSWPLAESEFKTGHWACGRYFFNPVTIKKGEGIIRTAINDRADLVVIDEIGKCELNGMVWDSAFRSTIAASRNVMIVVSKRNLPHILSAYGIEFFLLFDPSEITVEQAVADIVNHLGSRLPHHSPTQ
jgi:nucleoside-triphosphatase THEP1